ncbi:MAG: hypothetical protein ACK5X5_12360, partial [bacterium]
MSRRRQPIIIDFEATICRADSDPSEIAQGVSRGTRYAHSHTVSEAAGKLVAYYWLGALIGRLAGGFILRLFRPGRVLTACAAGAIGL